MWKPIRSLSKHQQVALAFWRVVMSQSLLMWEPCHKFPCAEEVQLLQVPWWKHPLVQWRSGWRCRQPSCRQPFWAQNLCEVAWIGAGSRSKRRWAWARKKAGEVDEGRGGEQQRKRAAHETNDKIKKCFLVDGTAWALEPQMWYKEWVQSDVLTKCLSLYMQCGKVFCSHTRRLPGSWKLPASEKQQLELMKRFSRNYILWWQVSLRWFRPQKCYCSVQVDNRQNPNIDSTSIHFSAATARMKTNLLKDNISIQFEVEICNRTPRDLQTVLRILSFLMRWMDWHSRQWARFTGIKSLTQRTVYSFSVQNNFPIPLPSNLQTRATFDSLHVCAIFPESFRMNRSVEVWHFLTYHVLCDTLFDALKDHAWDLGIGSSLSRIQDSTTYQFCLCCFVDSPT